MASERSAVWTIGHSTHPIEEFAEHLQKNDIQQLIDVRSFPSSRHCPQFNLLELSFALESYGISYLLLGASLGGRRGARYALGEASPNMGWHLKSFRNYADYSTTQPFLDGLCRLQIAASEQRSAFMCAEGLPWRCHRQLIASAMVARGWQVDHIMPGGKTTPHVPGKWGPRMVVAPDGKISYPAE